MRTDIDYNSLDELASASVFGFLDPVLLRRIFLLYVRDLYSDTKLYGHLVELKNLVYSPDKKLRTLDVDLDYVYDPEEIAKRPSVYVGVGGITFQKQAINNFAGSYHDGQTLSTMEMKTSIVFKHMSNYVDVSLNLASLTANHLAGIRPVVHQRFPAILSYELASISAPSLVEGSKVRLFQTNTTFNMALNAGWEHLAEKILIKNINTTVNPVNKS